VIRSLWQDAVELTQSARGYVDTRAISLKTLRNDLFRILLLQRMRESSRRHRVLGAGHALRMVQTVIFGIEIGKDVTLGRGVYFVHPVGITIGGDARVGDRVRFYGNNTVGTAKENGYPVIEDDVVVGAGARILGPVRVGARSSIGANAVVLTDIPPDSIAVGMPARARPKALSRDRSGVGAEVIRLGEES